MVLQAKEVPVQRARITSHDPSSYLSDQVQIGAKKLKSQVLMNETAYYSDESADRIKKDSIAQ